MDRHGSTRGSRSFSACWAQCARASGAGRQGPGVRHDGRPAHRQASPHPQWAPVLLLLGRLPGEVRGQSRTVSRARASAAPSLCRQARSIPVRCIPRSGSRVPARARSAAWRSSRSSYRPTRAPIPSSPRHVGELGIGARVGRYELRLERHAADRARAGTRLPDLGMQFGQVHRARRHRLGAPRLVLEILCGIGHELLLATGRAEVVRAPIVGVAMPGGVRVDRHAAHRVLDALLRMPVRTVPSMR